MLGYFISFILGGILGIIIISLIIGGKNDS